MSERSLSSHCKLCKCWIEGTQALIGVAGRETGALVVVQTDDTGKGSLEALGYALQDKASDLPLDKPERYRISRSYCCNCNAHHTNQPVGSLTFINQERLL